MDLSKVKSDKDMTDKVFICEQCNTTRYGAKNGVPKCHMREMKEYKNTTDDEGTGSLDHIHW